MGKELVGLRFLRCNLLLFILLVLSTEVYAGIPPTRWKEDGTSLAVAPANVDCQSNITCTKNGNTIEIDGLAGGSGDGVTVNTTAVDTTANFLDNIYTDFALTDGGAGGPDDVTAKPNYNAASGDLALLTNEVAWALNGLVSEGVTADLIEGRFAFPDWATTDKVITFQDATHTVVGRDTTDTLTNKTLAAADNVITLSEVAQS